MFYEKKTIYTKFDVLLLNFNEIESYSFMEK